MPFHFYAPDVFQGVPASNAAMLSFMPKVVGFVALVRLAPLTGATLTTQLWLPDGSAGCCLAVLAVATMFVGNLMALRQKQLFRLLAYSSIAHAGYMLVGLAVGNVGAVGGTSAVLFYLAVVRPDDDRRVRPVARGRQRVDAAGNDRRPPRSEPFASLDRAVAWPSAC